MGLDYLDMMIIHSPQPWVEVNQKRANCSSWIACGKNHVDLVRASQILADEFHVKRMGIVGGSKINTAF